MSDRGVESGFYMRSLSRREALAAMALMVVEYLMAQERCREAITVTEIILRHNPRDGMAWANQGNAYKKLLRAELLDTYETALLIPRPSRARYLSLLQRNHAAFGAAAALGWEPIE